MKKYKKILIGCVVFLFVSIRLTLLSPQIEFNSDEISWFYHTEFFNQLFLKHNLDKEFWTSYESYDHPQLSKYIFGGYLFLRDKNIFAKRDALEQQWGRWNFYFDEKLSNISSTDFAQYIFKMREVNIPFTVGSLMVLFLCLSFCIGNMYVAFLIPVLLTYNSLFTTTMLRATSDAQMVFFVLLSVWALCAFGTKKNIYSLLLFGFSVGSAVSVKLTGMIMFAVFLVNEYIFIFLHTLKITDFFKRFAIVLFAAGMIWFVSNPALYGNFFGGTGEYVSFRLRQSVKLERYFRDVALTDAKSRIVTTFCSLVNPACAHHPGSMTPNVLLNSILFCFGCAVWVKKCKNDFMLWPIFIFIISVLTINTAYLPLDSDRYYLLPVITMYLVYAAGFEEIWSVLRKYAGKATKNPA